MSPQPSEIRSFYDAAWLGLRALDARPGQGRRFGADPDARWKLFAGHLHPCDRVDLLVRDGAAQHPLAFAPRAVFGLPGLASDEAFGPDWPGVDAVAADRLLRETSPPATPTVADALVAVAASWGLSLTAEPSAELAQLTASTRVALAGAQAVVHAAAAFDGRAGFDFGDQVTLVADAPAPRQLLGLAAALLDTRAEPTVLTPADVIALGADDAPPAPDVSLATPDASPAARSALRRLSNPTAGSLP